MKPTSLEAMDSFDHCSPNSERAPRDRCRAYTMLWWEAEHFVT
jgi:hypothetical protein